MVIMAVWLNVAAAAMILTALPAEARESCGGPFVCSVMLDISAVTDLR
jgi:hypothetical protein